MKATSGTVPDVTASDVEQGVSPEIVEHWMSYWTCWTRCQKRIVA